MDHGIGDVEAPEEDDNSSFDILDDEEKALIWADLMRERQRHSNLEEREDRLRASNAARKKRKRIADASRRRNRD